MNKKLLQKGIRVLLPVLFIAVIAYFLLDSPIGKKLAHLRVGELSDYLRSFGAFSVVLGMAIVYIQVMLPFVPFVLVAGANVLVFGLFWGFMINYTMAVLGSFSAFLFARYVGHARVEKRLVKYPAVKQFNQKLEERGFFYVLVGRLIPVIPSTAISLGAGITKIRGRDFLLGTILGKLPMVLLESMIGHDLLHFHKYKGRFMILCAIFVLLLVIGSFFKNKLTGKPME